jgi:hypothetical protein
MCNLLRRFYRESKLRGSRISPCVDGFGRRHAIESGVNLDSRKMSGIVGQHLLVWKVMGIEQSLPFGIAETGCADPNRSHLWIMSPIAAKDIWLSETKTQRGSERLGGFTYGASARDSAEISIDCGADPMYHSKRPPV